MALGPVTFPAFQFLKELPSVKDALDSDRRFGRNIQGSAGLSVCPAWGPCFHESNQVGALLRLMASMKPGGRLLEIGTGTGVSTCWLLDGMDSTAKLTTVDINPKV